MKPLLEKTSSNPSLTRSSVLPYFYWRTPPATRTEGSRCSPPSPPFHTRYLQHFRFLPSDNATEHILSTVLSYSILLSKIQRHSVPTKYLHKLLLLLLHPFNGLFATTTWVSRHQKGKPFWILMEQKTMRW